MTMLAPAILLLVATLGSADAAAQGQAGETARQSGNPPTNAAAQPPAAVQSNDETTDGSNIVVTARRREERIGDVPAAVDVLDRQTIDDQGGLVTLEDIANNAPSVNFAATTTPATAEISMRGSATARSTNAEGGVGLYRNGTFVGGGRRGGRSFTRMDFLDADRVEVLRGVQGALYGRNAVGGAVNLINAKPEFEDSGYIRAGYGSYIFAEVQGAVNLRLSDKFAVRISGDLMEQGEGAFFNPFTRKHFDEQRARGIRGQIRFASGPLDVTLMGEKSFVKNPPLIFALNIAPSTVFPRGIKQDPYNIPWNGRSVANQRTEMGMLTVGLDLGFGKLTAIGSLRRRETDHGFDADGLDPVFLAALRASGGGGLTTDAFQESLQLDQTTNKYGIIYLTDNGDGPLRWLAGYEHVSILSDSQFSTTRTPTPANRSPGSIAITDLDTHANAVFGSLGYSFSDRLSLSGEIRYTREKKQLITDRFDQLTGLSQGARFKINSGSTQENVSYNLTLSYRLSQAGLLTYARYGTGFRAGGFNDDLGDPRAPDPVTPNFDSETVTNYEIGLKGPLAGRMNFAAALYQSDTEDNLIQVTNGCAITVPQCPVAPTIFLRNAGDARVRGGEAQIDGRVRLGGGVILRLSGSVGYIDAKVIRGRDAGRRIPQVPDWLFRASANLTAPVSDRVRGFANLQYSSRAGGVQEIDQVPPLVDFFRLDARMGVRFSGVELAVFVDNLTDERYKVFATNTTERANYPRTWGIQFTKRWQ